MTPREHLAKPAISRVNCWCGDEVKVRIPVLVTLEDNRIWAQVDQESDYGQELWDHMLVKHGPRV